jgi:hypothetical protein
MNRKHHVQTGLQNHVPLVLLRQIVQPTWGAFTFEAAPARAPGFNALKARIARLLKTIKSWYRVTGQKPIATLCTVAMFVYVLGAIALGVALLFYTFTR